MFWALKKTFLALLKKLYFRSSSSVVAVTTMLWGQSCYEVTIECPMIVQDIFIDSDLSKLHRMIRGHSKTYWTRFSPFLTTYLPQRGHFLP